MEGLSQDQKDSSQKQVSLPSRGDSDGTLSSHLSRLFFCVLETSFVSPHAAPMPTPQCKTGLPQPSSPSVGLVGFHVGLWRLLTPAPPVWDTGKVRFWDTGDRCVTNGLFLQVLVAGLPACERFALGYSCAEDGKTL